MDDKIALEEHFAVDETLADSQVFVPDRCWSELRSRLLDVDDGRLRQMDANGIEWAILSLNAPAVQRIADRSQATGLARLANDWLAKRVAARSDRFRAFAALPIQDPEAAVTELVRAVTELGMVGVLVNGYSESSNNDGPAYYDHLEYRPFWAEVERLGVPFYLHPRNPARSGAMVGHQWLLGPTWAFAQETAVHALRLMGSGIFDEHPRLQIILGHLGEGLPAAMWRIDNRNAWTGEGPGHAGRRTISEYFRSNFHLTTSGNFHTPVLLNAMSEIGVERIMFSTDWPFENMDHASAWFDQAPLADADRRKIGRLNAHRLFGLPGSDA